MSRGCSLISIYLIFKNMDHGRRFKQMRLCADFHARPSKIATILLVLEALDETKLEDLARFYE